MSRVSKLTFLSVGRITYILKDVWNYFIIPCIPIRMWTFSIISAVFFTSPACDNLWTAIPRESKAFWCNFPVCSDLGNWSWLKHKSSIADRMLWK
jgi:hypothetical protein